MGSKPRPRRGRSFLKRILYAAIAAALLFYAFLALCMVTLKFVNPFTTAVQMQRRVEAMLAHKPYKKRYTPLPMSSISAELQHAVVAGEDARFRIHNGIDWKEMEKVIDQDLEEGKLGRGGSTITQQLIKNLFLTTKRSVVRKGVEFLLAPLAEWILGKDRILDLYLNVIEWGPGVFGAEAAARYHYNEPAARVTRDQAARLAAIIPNPLKRKPERMDEYSEIIQTRMRQMGW